MLNVLRKPPFEFAYDARRWRLRLLFEYLRFSPTYWQYCQEQRDYGRAVKRTKRPYRVESQLETNYRLLGDVHSVPFSEWFPKRGKSCFGLGLNASVRPVLDIPSAAEASMMHRESLGSPVQRVLRDTVAVSQNFRAALLLVPLTRDISANIRLIRKELVAAQTRMEVNGRVQRDRTQISAYKVTHTKQTFAFLFESLLLVAYCAANWNRDAVKQWQLGGEFGMMPHLYDKAAIGAAVDERNVLGAAVSRRLRETLLIAENAALGQFPCNAPLKSHTPEWDFDGEQLLSRMRGWAVSPVVFSHYRRECRTVESTE